MLKWTLKDYLDANDVSAYRLVQATSLSPNTVYALARGEHERISLTVLEKVLSALVELTGKPVTPNDLLEFVGEDAPRPEKRTWTRLRGKLDDPESPGNVAEDHDMYLAQAQDADQKAGTLRGKS